MIKHVKGQRQHNATAALGAAPRAGRSRTPLHTEHAGHTPPQSMRGQSLHPANESRQAHRNTEFLQLPCKKLYKVSPPRSKANTYYSALKITALGERVLPI